MLLGMPAMNNLLLDTHVFIWLMNGDATLPLKVRKNIASALVEGNVYLSAISCWEIAMLEQRKRIVLTKPCLEWINEGLSRSGIEILALTPGISVESCKLSEFTQGDPADRIIVASARLTNSVLVTRDKVLLAYGKKHHVMVM